MKLRGRVIRETALPKTHSGQVILSRHHYPRTPCGQALLLRHHYPILFAGKPYCYVIITRYYTARSIQPSRDFFWLLTVCTVFSPVFPLYFPLQLLIRRGHYNASSGFGLWAKALRGQLLLYIKANKNHNKSGNSRFIFT